MLKRFVLALVIALLLIAGFVLLTGGGNNSSETSYVGTYRSALLPAASSSGRIIVLQVKPDGAAVMTTDYQNNEPPVSQEGQWATDGDALVLTLSVLNGRPAPRPLRVSFLRDGDTIHSVGSEAEFGSVGITLTRQ